MYTEWGSWSSCNHCGEPGERVKMGICYARTRLDEFRGGVPCRSNAVPYKERSKYSYDKRKDEKEIGTCNAKCPPKPKATGKKAIVKTFALSAGIPTLPKLVKRRVYYEDVGNNAELVCPEAGVTHGVRWMNGSKTLRQMEFIKANSRFRIDHLNRLYIENVQFYDSRNYTCWFENKQIAVVIIKVVEAPSIDEDMEGNAMYVGMVLVFLVFFYIVLGVCKNRKLQTIQ
ncbi:Ig-like V-type domain-containing protein FAM187A [Strongylocentrotus purpuratus]|uniref:Ig-like domain-containing protein n=1 Tax=Strongylocentrotus purpuratus TaxID=7668 RepID=A0A7M7N0A6_STRPU|nr:Ig-like V-type domain-containing protein FAM187A [Strongylocentrotus purpuratus]